MKALFSTKGFSIRQYHRDISIAKDRILVGSQIVKTAGGRIEYSTFGRGLPVLFIHGAGGGHDMGREFAKLMGDDFFWICPLNDQKATISDKQYDLHKIKIATLILHALDDCLVEFDFAKYAHMHIPESKLITFPSGGHMLLGQHEKCRQVVTGFLKENL
jgi:pimeloyl-ACP methyl ester carboxylesterase